MRLLTLCLGVALLAPAAGAQDLTVERDGDTVTLTRPDGTVERFTVDPATPLRVRSKDGPLVIEREDGESTAPRAFAFRHRPGDTPFPFEDFDFEVFDDEHRAHLDSLRHRVLRFRNGPRGLDAEALVQPWLGFERRGVAPETRREIADGERRSRELARELRRAEGAERERLRRELRETLEQTFERKQQARREQVEALREDADRRRSELAELQAELEEREAARRAIIDRRERDLLGEDDALDW